MSLIQKELLEQENILNKPLSGFDNDDDTSLEENESYIFHKKLHKIAVIAFEQFINAIPDDYSEKEKIKEIITVIEDHLVY